MTALAEATAERNSRTMWLCLLWPQMTGPTLAPEQGRLRCRLAGGLLAGRGVRAVPTVE